MIIAKYRQSGIFSLKLTAFRRTKNEFYLKDWSGFVFLIISSFIPDSYLCKLKNNMLFLQNLFSICTVSHNQGWAKVGLQL